MDTKYLELVKRCPLLPITNKKAHAAAKAMILELTDRDGTLSRSEIGYGQVLVQLIQAYERKQVDNFFSGVEGSEALQYLLTEHNIKQTEAAHIAGISKQNLNDFLNGRRRLPEAARIRLADHFNVQPDVFTLRRHATSA